MKHLLFGLILIGGMAGSCTSSQNTAAGMLNVLKAKWVLQSITGQPGVGSLFTGKIPALQFDTDAMRVSGNSGCNNLSGSFQVEPGGKLSLGQMISTKMACPGNGESIFMSALNKVTNFSVKGNTLSLLNGKEEIMRLLKE